MTTNFPFKTGDLIKFLIAIAIVILLMIFGTGCTSEKKIQERVKEGIRIDREVNKCANDTIFRLVPGEQLVLIDTVHHFTTDTFFNWTYDTAIITKTIRKVDTIKAFIRDDYKINSLNDSINVHKQAESNLQGQIISKDKQIQTIEKTSKNRLAIIIAIISFLTLVLGVLGYFKFINPLSSLKSALK